MSVRWRTTTTKRAALMVASVAMVLGALGGASAAWAAPAGPAAPAAAAPTGGSGPRAGDARLFPTWTGYEVGTGPVAVAAADFNGDGRTDVAYAHHSFVHNTIAVLLNIGGGTMGVVKTYPAADETNDIAAADLNHDGHPDLVAISEGLSETGTTVDVYLNRGTGTFAHSTVTGGTGPTRLAIADLNGDAVPDLALANNGPGDQQTTVSVLLGAGNGSFGPESRITVGPGVFGIAAADLNGDGKVDLAVGRATGQEDAYHVTVLRNTGSGFVLRADVTVPGIAERWPMWPVLAAADLDGDGKVDLVSGAALDDQLAVLRNQGNWSFAQTLYPGDFGATNLEASNIDADGHPDVIEASPFGGTQSTGEVAFFRGNGDGSLAAPLFINQGFIPNDVTAAADLSGDGRPDLAVANQFSGTGSIDPQLPNGGFAGAPVYGADQGLLPLDSASADFDGDGRIDMALDEIDVGSSGHDAVAIMHNTGGGRMQQVAALPSGTDSNPKAIIAADLNGDGHPDLAWTPEIFGNPATYPVAVAMNRGKGTFRPAVLYFPQTCGTAHVSAIDVNGDGALDLVVANNGGGPSDFCMKVSVTIRIMLNNGDGTFQPDYGEFVGTLSSMVAGGDLNGDGITDLVVTDAVTHVLMGTGGGQFAPHIDYRSRGNEVAVADFNDDGHPDVATSDGSFQSVWVMLNDGAGRFKDITEHPGEQIHGYLTGNAIAVADLDGDGHLDIAVSDPQGQDVGVFYGKAKGKFRQEIRYGVQYDFVDVNIADYDGDGRPDLGGPAGIGGALEAVTDGVTTLIARAR